MRYSNLRPYGNWGSPTGSAQIGADSAIAVLDRDGREHLMSLEQLRQEGTSSVRSLMNLTTDYGNRSVRVVAALYLRKYDSFGGLPFGSLPEALQFFSTLTSPLYQSDRPTVYAACFDLTRKDWWIPVAEFPRR
jgi:hypothetical protein